MGGAWSQGVPTPGGCVPCGDPLPDGYCCGRYASYWNAFLLLIYCGLLFVAADQTRMMQDQMSGAAMAMPPDPSKAFKVNHRILVSTCLCKQTQHTELLAISLAVITKNRKSTHFYNAKSSVSATQKANFFFDLHHC